jgi:hypothetical protein
LRERFYDQEWTRNFAITKLEAGGLQEEDKKKKRKKAGEENVQSCETSLDLCHSIFSNSGSFIISISIINRLTCQQIHLLDLPFMADTL